MKPSPNPSSSEKAKNLGRKSPRRHNDKISAGYDSADFPVLLRMPEMIASEPEDKQESIPAAKPAVASAPALKVEAPVPFEEPVATPPPTQQRRRSKPSFGEKEKHQTTAKSSRIFWSALAPKAAIGGMLLSLTALCVIVLQGPSTDDAKTSPATQWAAEDESAEPSNAKTDDLVVPVPATIRPYSDSPNMQSQADHTIASKPESPRVMPVPLPNSSQSNTAVPKPPVRPSSEASGSSEGWPMEATPFRSSTPVNPANSTSFQADGWPDELDAGTSSDEMELELNPAIRSAMRQRAAARGRASAGPEARSNFDRDAGGTQLDGTVEIPQPQSDLLKLR